MVRSSAFGRADIRPHAGRAVSFSGYTVLSTAEDGSIGPDPDAGPVPAGLFDFDTRILSLYRLLLDGEAVPLVSASAPSWSRRSITLRRELEGGTPEGPRLPRDSLEVTIRRRMGRGMLEEIELANHSALAMAARLELEVDADFQELIARAGDRRPVGAVTRAWDGDARVLELRFRAEHDGRSVERGLRLRVVESTAHLVGHDGGLRFDLDLEPKGRAHVRLAYESLVDDQWRSPLELGDRVDDRTAHDDALDAFAAGRTQISMAAVGAGRPFETAADDLAALRMFELDPLARPAGAEGADADADAPDGWIPAAGMPLFPGIFGRDILTAGLQSLLVTPEIARGALEVAARTQATTDSPEHDAQPGRMIHEMRRGPLSDLGIIPQRAYYGSQTTPAMYVLTLSELWHWTGDDDLLRRHLGPALRTFEWADRYGDLDGDGFLEYLRRARVGPTNQGWKDADDAIRDADGRNIEAPIATVEEQAFHYVALLRMAEILVALEDGRADAFLERAAALRRRWDEAFWLPDEGFYAMALGPDKQQVRSIGSNVGHALATAIIPQERARAVADRLFAPDLFSGWGVRTLSRDHPSYNPFSYHLGSVWPVENATFALGLKRYGFDEDAERLVTALVVAASHFEGDRLPEAISGHGTDERTAPSLYPRANTPQAWSASATIQLLQVLLGLYPYAPLGLLALVRPRLPEWLPSVTLRNVRIGDATVTLRFERDADGTAHHEVVEQAGRLIVLPAPPPQALATEGASEALKAWLIEHAPGRLARAMRIALGVEG